MSTANRVNTGVKKTDPDNKKKGFKLSPQGKIILPLAGIFILLIGLFLWYRSYVGSAEYKAHEEWHKNQKVFIECFKENYGESRDSLILEAGDNFARVLTKHLGAMRASSTPELRKKYNLTRERVTKGMTENYDVKFEKCEL